MKAIISLMNSKGSKPKSKRSFHVVIEKDEAGNYVGIVPELPGCHSQARSRTELTKRVKEAIELYLESHKDASPKIDFVGVQLIDITV